MCPCLRICRINIVKIAILPKSNLHIQFSCPENFNGILHRIRKKKRILYLAPWWLKPVILAIQELGQPGLAD
jgi:hypothetical protein